MKGKQNKMKNKLNVRQIFCRLTVYTAMFLTIEIFYSFVTVEVCYRLFH